MRNLKRALSLALASVMLMGMMVVGSSASYADVDSADNVEAIEVLQAVGIMTGDEKGNFNPDALVTRNEMAVIMCNLLDYTTASYKGTSPFADRNDVPEWAEPYVAACYTNGIIAGISATTYGGGSSVTTGQGALMLMKALGYFQEPGDFGQDWLVATVSQGAKIALFDGIDTGARDAMTRNDVAKMVLNALEAECVEITSHDLTADGNGNLTTKAVYGPRTGTSPNYSVIDTTMLGTRAIVNLGEELYSGRLVKSTSQQDEFGRPSTVWTYRGDKVGTYADKPSQTIVLDKTSSSYTLEDMLQDSDYFNLDDGTTTTQSGYVDLDGSDTTKAINGWTNIDADHANFTLKAGDVVEIFNNKYGFTTAVAVTRYTLAQVDEVDDNVTAAHAKDGTKAYIDLVDLGGVALGQGSYRDNRIADYTTANFAEGKFVAVALSMKASPDTDKIIGSHAVSVVSGGISDYRLLSQSKPYVITGGTRYPISGNMDSASTTDTNVDFVDGQYELYLDANGYVLGIEGTHKVNINDVYYVTGVVKNTSGLYNSKSYYAQAVSLVDGTVREIQLETNSFEDLAGVGSFDAPTTLITTNAGLYSFSDNDAGSFTVDETASNSNDSYTARTNNGKLTATAYTGDGDDYFVDSAASTSQIKRSDSSTTIGTRVYLEKTTQYITVESSGANIDVDTYTGGVNAPAGLNGWVVYSRSGSARVAEYVILAGASVGGATDTSDVVYLKSTPDVRVLDGFRATLYKVDGTELADVTVASRYTGQRFYTYDLRDGVYTLSTITNTVYGTAEGALGSNFVYDKQTGRLDDVVLDSIYNNGLTIKQFLDNNNTVDAGDVDASNAVVMDTRSAGTRDSSVYRSEITTLAQLEAAMKRGYVVADLYYDDDEILLVSVISVIPKVEVTFANVDCTSASINGTDIALQGTGSKTATLTVGNVPAGAAVTATSGTVAAATVGVASNVVTITTAGAGTTTVTVTVKNVTTGVTYAVFTYNVTVTA